MEYIARTPGQLGQILKGYRQQQGLSQQLVGERVGVRQSQISVIEAKEARATVETLFKVLSGLGLELVLRETPKGEPPAGEW